MIIVRLSGGLGNQMFQYAFGRATAKRLGAELAFDLSDATLQIHSGCELDRAFNLELRTATEREIKSVLGVLRYSFSQRLIKKLGLASRGGLPYVVEPHFSFSSQMRSVPDNRYLSGYWQSEKYFEDAIGYIREDFTFRTSEADSHRSLVAEICREKETAISLHVRRGDYINNKAIEQVYGKCTQEYYCSAIEYLTGKVSSPKLYVFSDDMNWVRQNLKFRLPHKFVEHNRGKSSYQDMHLMSMCGHHILANSSFSWWGAWLNSSPKRIVVAPKNWFVDDRNTADLYPAGWVTL